MVLWSAKPSLRSSGHRRMLFTEDRALGLWEIFVMCCSRRVQVAPSDRFIGCGKVKGGEKVYQLQVLLHIVGPHRHLPLVRILSADSSMAAATFTPTILDYVARAFAMLQSSQLANSFVNTENGNQPFLAHFVPSSR